MKQWSWFELLFKFILRPKQAIKFLKLPRSYEALDEWLRIDHKKSDIVANVIHCRCVESFKEQQRKNMQYRCGVAQNFADWRQAVQKKPHHKEKIRKITEEFKAQKLCHRDYDSGIRCYCDTHNCSKTNLKLFSWVPETLRWYRDVLVVNFPMMAHILKVSPEPMSMWMRQIAKPSNDSLRKLRQLKKLKELSESIFGNKEDIHRWFYSDVHILNASPITLVKQSKWSNVIEILAGLESGTHI